MRYHVFNKSVFNKPAIYLLGVLLTAAGSANSASGAEIYRWKDANGKYHYSDQLPQNGDADKVKVEAPAPKPNPELEEFRQQVRVNLASLDAERAQAERDASMRKIIAARQERNCTSLRNAMRAEEQVAVLYTFDASGEIQHLTDQQRSNYKNDLQTQWQHYCRSR